MGLLLIALFGLIVPNGIFIHWLLTSGAGLGAMLTDRLALGFIMDCFLAMGLLAYHYARRPIGPVRWPWFIVLSIVGGLGFSLPFYWWLNERRS